MYDGERIDRGLSKIVPWNKREKEQAAKLYMRVLVRVNTQLLWWANLIVFLAYQNYYRYYTFSLRYFVNVVPFINFTLCSRFVQLCVRLANAYTHIYEEWNGMVFGKWEMGNAMSIHKSRNCS